MSVATELTRIQTAKSNIKAAIEAKGVSIPSTATIDTYPTYVQEIPQGGGGGSADAFRITNRTATAGTITIAPVAGSPAPIVLKASSDGTNWTSYEISASTNITLPANGYVMFDASDSPNPLGYDIGASWGFNANVDHNVSGKISSLLPRGIMTATCFSKLFRGGNTSDAHLIDASGLIMDIEYLPSYAYHWMFYGCSNLIAAPALPSTHIGEYCYQSMFNGCSSLITAPELPATTLKKECYSSMFDGCRSLVVAPVLSAATLLSKSYYRMFRDCTSLSSITCFAMSKISDATTDWVKNINTTGILYVASGTSVNWTQGNNGYPSTWELKVYGEEPPTPTGRTLTISNIPTPPIPTGGEDVFVAISIDTTVDAGQGIYTYMEFKKEYVNDEFVVTMTIGDGNWNPVTGYTTAYTDSALTISGPWGDDVSIGYTYSDGDINCEQVPSTETPIGETFTGDTISLTFPTLEVSAECECGKEGGDWDGDNNVCVHPTGLLFRLSSIPDDGNVHTVTITDADSRECTLSIDMSGYSYTESADADDKYSVHMENDDIANSTAEWMIEGNMYGTYTIDVDGNTLLNEPDYDGSGNFVLVTYDYNNDTMTNYCSRDAFDCAAGGGTYDCQTGECGYA